MLQVASSPLPPPTPMSVSGSNKDSSSHRETSSKSPRTMLAHAPIRNPTSISVASKSVRPYPATPSHHRRQQQSSSHQPFLVSQPEQQPLWTSNSVQSSSPEALYPSQPSDHHQLPRQTSDDGFTLDPVPSAASAYSEFDSSRTNANFGVGSSSLEQEREYKHHQSSSSPTSHSHPNLASDAPNLGPNASINPHEASPTTISGDRLPSVDSLSSPSLSASTPKPQKSGRSKRQSTSASAEASSSMATRNPSNGPREGGGRSSQPKSSRKQFSACGACQLRQLSDSLPFLLV